ncbi:hypothetical protein PAXINDRAFT_96239 [Paxillus involutus ATCC 200175]|nr:hypothetical protein PAXINDRAFT_96239 [Paxillus involutus ATCC 200175]
MSSISFPHSADDDLASSSSSLHNSMHAQFYTPPSFDASNSFQINPLSAHPPRTPRPSTTAQSQFGSMSISVYDEKAEEQQDWATEKGAPVDNEVRHDPPSFQIPKSATLHRVSSCLYPEGNLRYKLYIHILCVHQPCTGYTRNYTHYPLPNHCVPHPSVSMPLLSARIVLVPQKHDAAHPPAKLTR